MKAYSEDLRERIVAAVESGMNKCEAARVFGVCLNSVKRYVSLKHSTGQLAPKPRAGQKANISGAKVEILRQQIKANPDATLQQHSDQWEQTQGVKLSRSTFSRTLKRHKITYKKKPKSQ